LEIAGLQIGNVAGGNGDGAGIDGEGTDCVVGAVGGAGFVDGEGLEYVQTVGVAPIDHLADAIGIADAEIVFGANGEDGFEDACERLVRI